MHEMHRNFFEISRKVELFFGGIYPVPGAVWKFIETKNGDRELSSFIIKNDFEYQENI